MELPRKRVLETFDRIIDELDEGEPGRPWDAWWVLSADANTDAWLIQPLIDSMLDVAFATMSFVSLP